MTEHTKRIQSLRKYGATKKQEQIAELQKQVRRIKFRMYTLATVYEDQRDKLHRALVRADNALTKAQQVKITKGMEVHYQRFDLPGLNYQGTVLHIFPGYKKIPAGLWAQYLGYMAMPTRHAGKVDIIVVETATADRTRHVLFDRPHTWEYARLRANLKGNWEQIRGVL